MKEKLWKAIVIKILEIFRVNTYDLRATFLHVTSNINSTFQVDLFGVVLVARRLVANICFSLTALCWLIIMTSHVKDNPTKFFLLLMLSHYYNSFYFYLFVVKKFWIAHFAWDNNKLLTFIWNGKGRKKKKRDWIRFWKSCIFPLYFPHLSSHAKFSIL